MTNFSENACTKMDLLSNYAVASIAESILRRQALLHTRSSDWKSSALSYQKKTEGRMYWEHWVIALLVFVNIGNAIRVFLG